MLVIDKMRGIGPSGGTMKRKDLSIIKRSWAWLALLAAILLTLPMQASQLDHPKAHLTMEGKITATDSEASECYWQFATGANAMVFMTKPGSDLCTFFRGKVGSWVRVTIVPIEAPK